MCGFSGKRETRPGQRGGGTELVLAADDKLVITAFNIPPQGQEARAVETVYTRQAD